MDDFAMAASEGRIDDVKEMLHNYSISNEDLNDALLSAVCEEHRNVAKLLIEEGANVDAIDGGGVSVLTSAVISSFVDVVEILFFRGANINSASYTGFTALMAAAEAGNVEMAQLLIERGANIDAVNLRGETAAVIAFNEEHNNVVELIKLQEMKRSAKVGASTKSAAGR